MGHLRVLVVEDDALIGSLLSEVLSNMGHHVVAVVITEAGGIEVAALYEPDIMSTARHRDGTGCSARVAWRGDTATGEGLIRGSLAHLLKPTS